MWLQFKLLFIFLLSFGGVESLYFCIFHLCWSNTPLLKLPPFNGVFGCLTVWNATKKECVVCSFLVSSSTDSSCKYVLELMSARASLAEPPLLPNNCPSVLQLHVKLKLNTSSLCRYWKHVWRTAVTDSTFRWLTETSSMAWWSKSSRPRTTLQPSCKTKFCHSYRYHGVFYPLYPFVVVVILFLLRTPQIRQLSHSVLRSALLMA